jgi:hypothetical protein
MVSSAGRFTLKKDVWDMIALERIDSVRITLATTSQAVLGPACVIISPNLAIGGTSGSCFSAHYVDSHRLSLHIHVTAPFLVGLRPDEKCRRCCSHYAAWARAHMPYWYKFDLKSR